MPFKKGQPRPANAGRKKGSLNKNKDILEDLREIRTETGEEVNLVKMFFAALDTMPPYQQVDALLSFMEFVYPKKKHIEFNPSDDQLRILLIERLKNVQQLGEASIREVSPALVKPN